jgi:hypothetical protein
MPRRKIDKDTLPSVLRSPEQAIQVREGRIVLQSRVGAGMKQYLIRVFVDIDRDPAEVVTVYRTGRVDKY